MPTMPQITVQLVHIQGSLKGEIQEFTDNEIRIGRHPDCHVMFPKQEVTLSRQHARIIREGNRFKLIDESTNGSFVNGKRITEAYLKDGDVITFSEGGPKISFLTQTGPGLETYPPPAGGAQPRPPVERPPNVTTSPIPPPKPAAPPAAKPKPRPVAASVASVAQAAPVAPVAVVSARAPLAIQYGVALKSFQNLPITIGRGADCDFVIEHPSLQNQHVQIFFAQDQYWIKDLTGLGVVSVNNVPLSGQGSLAPDSRVALSPQGPMFRFLGGGRLVEIEDQPAPAAEKPPEPTGEEAKTPTESGGFEKKAGALFKKFFT